MRLLTLILLALPLLASATAEKTFNYADADTYCWGTGKLESYDIAVKISEPSLVGSEITRIDVPVISDDLLENCSIWLSSRLSLDGKINDPDILSVTVTPSAGILSLILDRPCTVPKGGLYVGYSFGLRQLTPEAETPVSVTSSDNPDAFFIHTSRKYLSWGTFGLGLAADIAVTLRGDFYENAVAITAVADEGVLHGCRPEPVVTLRNRGNKAVGSIDYTFTINGHSESRHVDYNPPLAPDYTADVALAVGMEPIDEAGTYPWEISVTTVNDTGNEESDHTGRGDVYIYPYLPEHRPLMEEYTGTWCGWCPRGMTGMEKLSQAYPDRFVGVAYHTDKDVMNIGAPKPADYKGAPSAWLDRAVTGDPYNGLSDTDCVSFADGIGKLWNDMSANAATAGLTAAAVWTDEEMTRIDVTAEAVFIRPYTGAPFRFIYILTADGLSGEGSEWKQSNYFSGQEKYRGTDLGPLVDMPRKIQEMEFDDVAILSPCHYGVENSLPADIPYLTPVCHSLTLDLADAVNTDGLSLVQDKKRLHAVVAIVDASTGRIVNAVKTPVASPAGLTGSGNVAEEVEACCYDLQGRPTDASCPGIYVKRVIRSDGTVTTEKFRR